jgi:LPXTG-site transpeptidase (sortase) family protein
MMIAVTNITDLTATGNGTITDLGVPNPTAYGVVWSTALNPTTADNVSDLGAPGATGAFTAPITGLTPGTLYHVRAFATNTTGTSYGADVTFTTLSNILLPDTGFPQDKVTILSIQPADKAYTSTDLWLEIPNIGVKMSIVGVPATKDGWDVSWLDKNAGWLNGSAFPTWSGNSVLTGHVWDALNRPGPFIQLKTLKYGDQVKIHAFGMVYTYEITESSLITNANVKTAFKHEDKPVITLLTCESYQEVSNMYARRRMVRAMLVSVAKEK